MDPWRFTTIAHASHDFCNPLGAATLDRFVERLELAPGARVLDAGCGKGELLIRVLARWPETHGVGVDLNPAFLANARRRATGRVPHDAIEWIERRVEDVPLPENGFDLTICIGSAHVFGDLAAALAALHRLTRPGGRSLIGHGYWQREPDAEYLASFGATADELTTHAANLDACRTAGWEVLDSAPSTAQDWDAYESAYSRNLEHWAAAHPADPDHDAFVARSRNWFRSYQRWGHDTMGFALYDLKRSLAPV